jgi:anti-sigma regulatory factor (Ser/Thr protein kinase)
MGGAPRSAIEDRTPDNAKILRRLRQAFPDWGFVHDPRTGAWTAVRGTERHGVTIRRSDPLSLKLAVEEIHRGHVIDLQKPVDLMVGAWPGLRMHQPLRPLVLDDWIIPRVAEVVADTRHRIRALAERVVGYGELSHDVELMAGELLDNAVQHGSGDKAHVRVTAGAGVVRVEVRDCGSGPAQEAAKPELMSEHGRGLFIVASLATKWGISHTTGGTVAWFEVERRC